MKQALSNFNVKELGEILTKFGQPAFRAKQLFCWVQSGADFSEMSNLPKNLISSLQEEYEVTGVKIIKKLVSTDGTVKYLFALSDGNVVEGVLMKIGRAHV